MTPGSRVATCVATRASISRSWLTKSTVLFDARSLSSSQRLVGHVEGVVGLVEQQHLVGTAQQRLEDEPLLLAAGQRAHLAVLRLRRTGCDSTASVTRSQPASASYPPTSAQSTSACAYRICAGSSSVSMIASSAAASSTAASRTAGDGQRRQQVPDRAVVVDPADVLPHDPEPAAAPDGPRVRLLVAGDDPQQRRLAGTVGADERDARAVTDPERHVVEERTAVGQDVADAADVEVTHAPSVPVRPRASGQRD